MTDKVQKIKEEVERQKSFCKKTFDVLHPDDLDAAIAYAHIELLDRLLQFIDSIPEEPASEDLEEYYKKEFLPNEWFAKPGQRTISQFNYFTAHHFAEWGRNHFEDKSEMVSEDLDEAAKHYLYGAILYDDVYVGNPTEEDCIRCFKAGAEWQKQQMMKDAVEGVSCTYSNQKGTFLHIKKGLDTKDGDKVRIIIVKKEQQ